MDQKIIDLAPQIWNKISASRRILISLHVGADLDSIGSALGLKNMLEPLGKPVDVFCTEDLEFELKAKKHLLPGFSDIKITPFSAIDFRNYDLYICPDSETLGRISRTENLTLPLPIPTIVIDHHPNNIGFGEINLIITEGTSSSQIVAQLAKCWNLDLQMEAALCLYLGIWGDTGSFIYSGMTSSETYRVAADLIDVGQLDFPKLVWDVSATSLPIEKCIAAVQSRVEVLFSGGVYLAYATFADLQAFNLEPGYLSSIKNTVCHNLSFIRQPSFIVFLYQKDENYFKASFRSNNADNFRDVSLIAKAVPGGGGHKMAAACDLHLPLAEARNLILDKIKTVYPEMGEP